MNTQVINGNVNISDQVIAKIAGASIQNLHEVTALTEGRTKRTDKRKFYKAVNSKVVGLHTAE
ncbi:hypothetical protein D3C76_38110 [compost metagenome]